MTDRIDLNDAGEVDDVSIATEAGDTFRLERLDKGLVWIALYRADGRREVFEVSTPRNGRLIVAQTEESDHMVNRVDALKEMMRDERYWRLRDPAFIRQVSDCFSRLYARKSNEGSV